MCSSIHLVDLLGQIMKFPLINNAQTNRFTRNCYSFLCHLPLFGYAARSFFLSTHQIFNTVKLNWIEELL